MPRLPSLPFRALTYLKYASMPRGIGAYSDAGPLSGYVPPSTIDELVTPGVACGVACGAATFVLPNAPGMHTARAATNAAAAVSALFTVTLLASVPASSHPL